MESSIRIFALENNLWSNLCDPSKLMHKLAITDSSPRPSRSPLWERPNSQPRWFSTYPGQTQQPSKFSPQPRGHRTWSATKQETGAAQWTKFKCWGRESWGYTHAYPWIATFGFPETQPPLLPSVQREILHLHGTASMLTSELYVKHGWYSDNTNW